jgi:hypothetical protein
LFQKRPLKRGEYYANFSVDFTKTFFMGGFVYKSHALISAEVMKTGDTTSTPFGHEFRQKTDKNSQPQNSAVDPADIDLAVGDTVYYSHDGRSYKTYKIASVDKSSILLLAINPDDKNTLVSANGVFFNRKESIGAFKSGDNVMVEIPDISNALVLREGKVLGFADENILVETKSGFHVLPPTKVKKRN